ncbi:hypothetical protein GCM10010160_42470 [Acrocarpospora corrugata]
MHQKNRSCWKPAIGRNVAPAGITGLGLGRQRLAAAPVGSGTALDAIGDARSVAASHATQVSGSPSCATPPAVSKTTSFPLLGKLMARQVRAAALVRRSPTAIPLAGGAARIFVTFIGSISS